VTKLDDEVAASLHARSERRRHALTVLVGRLTADDDGKNVDLVDVLFGITSFEMFASLSERNRSPASVEALVQDLVEQTVKRFRAVRSAAPRGGRTKRTRGVPHET
jgi:hypothetical protein